MSPFVLTIVLAFALIVLALVGVAIGWLLTGEQRARHCGMGRGQARADVNCPICGGDTGKCPTDEEQQEDQERSS